MKQSRPIHLPADTEANYQTSHVFIITQSSEPAVISERNLEIPHAVNIGTAILFAVVIHSININILILLPRMT